MPPDDLNPYCDINYHTQSAVMACLGPMAPLGTSTIFKMILADKLYFLGKGSPHAWRQNLA